MGPPLPTQDFAMILRYRSTLNYIRGLGRTWRSEDVLSSAPFRLNVEIQFLAPTSLHG